MSKQALREGPMGKETIGERVPTLSGRWSVPLLSTLIVYHTFLVLSRGFQKKVWDF